MYKNVLMSDYHKFQDTFAEKIYLLHKNKSLVLL